MNKFCAVAIEKKWAAMWVNTKSFSSPEKLFTS
jgi:hypothetical protein